MVKERASRRLYERETQMEISTSMFVLIIEGLQKRERLNLPK